MKGIIKKIVYPLIFVGAASTAVAGGGDEDLLREIQARQTSEKKLDDCVDELNRYHSLVDSLQIELGRIPSIVEDAEIDTQLYFQEMEDDLRNKIFELESERSDLVVKIGLLHGEKYLQRPEEQDIVRNGEGEWAEVVNGEVVWGDESVSEGVVEEIPAPVFDTEAVEKSFELSYHLVGTTSGSVGIGIDAYGKDGFFAGLEYLKSLKRDEGGLETTIIAEGPADFGSWSVWNTVESNPGRPSRLLLRAGRMLNEKFGLYGLVGLKRNSLNEVSTDGTTHKAHDGEILGQSTDPSVYSDKTRIDGSLGIGLDYHFGDNFAVGTSLLSNLDGSDNEVRLLLYLGDKK
jgi:hypothetical protein